MNNNDEEEMFEDFACFDIDEPKKREICSNCQRPKSVCLCSSISSVSIGHTIIMLQHPMEVRRCLRTTRILELSLSPDRYHLFRGKRFPRKHYSSLYKMLGIDATGSEQSQQIVDREANENVQTVKESCAEKNGCSVTELTNENHQQSECHPSEGSDTNNTPTEEETILVFPTKNAIPISELSPNKHYKIVFLDGTWTQARRMYSINPALQSLKAVMLDDGTLQNQISRYVIRTQPNDSCVSTVEAVALVLSQLEHRPEIYDALTLPLKTICDFQLKNGAVEHQSRDYLVKNGLYVKQINKGITKNVISE